MFRRFITGFAGGLCLVVGFRTIHGGNHVLGGIVLLIGVINLMILIKEIQKMLGWYASRTPMSSL